MKSYTVCPNCGQKVLPVATRCPGCGLAFEAQFYQHPATPRRRRIPRGLLISGVVVTVVVANAVWQLIKTAPRPTPPPEAVVSASPAEPQAQPQRESTVAAAESLGAPPSPLPGLSSDSLPPGANGAGAAVSRVAGAMDTVGVIAVERRYASTWINVRAGRSGTAPVLWILRPGEVVRVDSLQQGWYRVVSEQPPQGYVDHSLLDSLPPAESP